VELIGSDVAKYLSGRNSLRDGYLERLHIEAVAGQPVITLRFRMRPDKDVEWVEIVLSDVKEVSFSHTSAYTFGELPFVTCFWTIDGEFYLSLDPYEEGISPSEADNDVFRAGNVQLTTPKP
jgi:hypothetical protein